MLYDIQYLHLHGQSPSLLHDFGFDPYDLFTVNEKFSKYDTSRNVKSAYSLSFFLRLGHLHKKYRNILKLLVRPSINWCSHYGELYGETSLKN